MNIRPYTYYFSYKSLLTVLAGKRVRLAKEEHDKLFHENLARLNTKPKKQNELYDIFPPRSQWIRLSKEERKGKPSTEVNKRQLIRTVLRATKNFKVAVKAPWHEKLMAFLTSVQQKAMDTSYEIPAPTVKKIFKKEEAGKRIFRPITSFDQQTNILIGQANRYLTQCFDQTFLPNSYAFRSVNKDGNPYSHHLAVEDIIAFKRRFSDEDLWVGECDIKKFFDCINHNVVKDVLRLQVSRCENLGILIEERPLQLLHSYLACYSFNRKVRMINLEPNTAFGWVTEEELENIGSDSKNDLIGIPQGGAFSCLLANVIMDAVDRKVLQHDNGQLFYARFCDDMVVMHPDHSICATALQAYFDGLKEVKLIGHNPIKIETYSAEFWKSKSKAPYLWGDRKVAGQVPWLSFVGYQVSYNKIVRVRKSSLTKEIKKQVSETGKVMAIIKSKNNFRISKRALKFRVQQRLIAMSVGRKSIYTPHKSGVMCWTAGFRVLKKEKHIAFQLKHLDRKRGVQLARLDAAINAIDSNRSSSKPFDPKAFKNEPKYYGAPYSYHYQLMKERK